MCLAASDTLQEIHMNRPIVVHQIKTISDYPLLVGEILRRADLRTLPRVKWQAFVKKWSGI